MERETNYPNWSVYIVQDGTMKHPYRSSKRVKLYEYSEAITAAKNVWKRYNTHKGELKPEKRETSVLILEYSAPYQARIKAIVGNPVDCYTGQ